MKILYRIFFWKWTINVHSDTCLHAYAFATHALSLSPSWFFRMLNCLNTISGFSSFTEYTDRQRYRAKSSEQLAAFWWYILTFTCCVLAAPVAREERCRNHFFSSVRNLSMWAMNPLSVWCIRKLFGFERCEKLFCGYFSRVKHFNRLNLFLPLKMDVH